MRFRKLRFAWSVMWGLACVLLIVLWVRSYYHNDVVYNVDKNLVETCLGSNAGTVYLFRSTKFRGTPGIRSNLGDGRYSITTIRQSFGWKHVVAESAKRKSMFDWILTGTT